MPDPHASYHGAVAAILALCAALAFAMLALGSLAGRSPLPCFTCGGFAALMARLAVHFHADLEAYAAGRDRESED
jgi:hypothetical protein